MKRMQLVTARMSAVRHHAEPQGGQTWLEEHNAQRVSHYEPTIFTLRQAGIHVEPHWFGPVKCAPTCASADTRCCCMRSHCLSVPHNRARDAGRLRST